MRVAAVIVRRLADVDGVEFLHEVSWNSPARRRKSWLTPDENPLGGRVLVRDAGTAGRLDGFGVSLLDSLAVIHPLLHRRRQRLAGIAQMAGEFHDGVELVADGG